MDHVKGFIRSMVDRFKGLGFFGKLGVIVGLIFVLALITPSPAEEPPEEVAPPTRTVEVTTTATATVEVTKTAYRSPRPAKPSTTTEPPRPTEAPEPTPTPAADAPLPDTTPADDDKPANQEVVVVNVVDGDTVDVSSGERIRISGIDTPEEGECGYVEATNRMSDLVLNQEVELVLAGADTEDRYGRLIRYVDVGGNDAGLTLIREGLAVARYDSRDGYGEHYRESEYVRIDAMTDESYSCTESAPPAPAPAPAPSSVYYKNCTAVREAGADPIYAGEPGYASHLDRDGDGVGCE